MKAKCINPIGMGDRLTFQKKYEVLTETDEIYYIIDDNGERIGYFKTRFEIIKEDKKEEVFNAQNTTINIAGINFNCKDTPCMFATKNWNVKEDKVMNGFEKCTTKEMSKSAIQLLNMMVVGRCSVEELFKKEDKMEEVRIVRKLEDLDGLENGMGLRVVASDVSDFKDYKNISVSVYKGDCRIADIKGPAKKKLETLKSMGFKAEYKPLRTKEEVIAEMTAKTDNIFKEDRNYDLYEVEFIKFTKHYKIRLAETVGAPVFVAGLAQKYADELNEILKNN